MDIRVADPTSKSVIHQSDKFPVIATPCGRLGPSTSEWEYVTCIPCLETAPNNAIAVERLRGLRAAG